MYNILRLKHEIRLDHKCGCQVRSQFANCEVLFKKLSEEQIKQFSSEVQKSFMLKSKGLEELNNQSEFLRLPYVKIVQYYDDLIMGDLMILQTIDI